MDRLAADLGWVALAAAALIFLVAQALLLAAALRTPRTSPREPRPPNAPRYRLSRGWEVVWTLLPAIGLLLLALFGLQVLGGPAPGRAEPSPTPTAPRGASAGVPPALAAWPGAAAVALLSSDGRTEGEWRRGPASRDTCLAGAGG